jgi:hypothetical protein
MLWGHFAKKGNELLSQFDSGELDAILRFLKEATQMQDEHRERISQKKT